MTADDPVREYLQHLDNHIFFYADIEVETCLQLNVLLRKLDKQYSREENSVIHLHINSFGGSVIAALATIDTMRSMKCEIHTYVEGGAASAATLIACMGAKRYIGAYSHMLIHQVRGESGGKLEEMEDEIKNTRQFMDIIEGIYKRYTKLKGRKLQELLKSDLWLNADICIAHGLVDEII